MPVDFELFEFASPPRTGVSWMLEACKLAGLGVRKKEEAITPWSSSNDRAGGKFRISVVRHPCDWLVSVYSSFVDKEYLHSKGVHVLWMMFAGFRKGHFDEFVQDYLRQCPGGISRYFNRYQCDSRLKIEDLPWALIEMLESFDVPKSLRSRVIVLEKKNQSRRKSIWTPHLRSQVMDAEREFCEELDYY